MPEAAEHVKGPSSRRPGPRAWHGALWGRRGVGLNFTPPAGRRNSFLTPPEAWNLEEQDLLHLPGALGKVSGVFQPLQIPMHPPPHPPCHFQALFTTRM